MRKYVADDMHVRGCTGDVEKYVSAWLTDIRISYLL